MRTCINRNWNASLNLSFWLIYLFNKIWHDCSHYYLHVCIPIITRVGWKVHRLTEKELCHINETRHALNSTFRDTNCIASFQINAHWIDNSGLWKAVLERLQKGLENWQRESFIKCVVVMAAVHDCGFELVDHPPYSPDLAPSDYFLFPTWKHTWLGSSIGPMMRSYLQLRTFSRIRMRA